MEKITTASFTERVGTDECYPAFLTAEIVQPNTVKFTARERGAGGEKIVTLEMNPQEAEDFACQLLTLIGPDGD